MNIWAWDSEDDSQGNIYWINFYDGKRHYSFSDRNEAYNFLKAQECTLWACNMEYDIANLISTHYEKIEFFFGKSRLIRAKLNKVTFLDTLNHWKMSVDGMGSFLGHKKKPFNPKSLEYCQCDTEIVYEFVKAMTSIYQKNLDVTAKSTIASTAFCLWRKINGMALGKLEKIELEYFKLAYYGGRTECFYIGQVKGQINYVDVNSMYPYCMLGELPYPYDFEKEADIEQEGISECVIESSIKRPILPYRQKDGRLVFANGTFRGIWANIELRYAESQGVKIKKILSGYHFKLTCDPFSDYVMKLYELKNKAKNDLDRYTYKLFLNCLYGKFGQGNERVCLVSLDKFLEMKVKPSGARIYNDSVVLYNEIGDYPAQTNYIWSLYVTAKARILLHRYISIVDKEAMLLYCDTDSIIYKGKADIKYSDKLGDMKLEGKHTVFEAKTSKIYKIDDIYRVKGVPRKYQKNYFDNDRATYQKPTRIKESIRRDLRPNVWIEYNKVKLTNYSKGNISKTGYVTPLILK